MPERHEHSYYEIALTATQMVVAFVLVLACLLAAFFAGVYVGRDGAMPALMADTQTAEQEAPAEETAAEGEPDAFDFFSEGEPQEAPSPPREIAERGDPSTTLLEDVGGEGGAQRQPEPSGDTRPREEPQTPAEEPPAEPSPAEPQPPAQGPVEQQETAAPAAGDGLIIQVFSSDNYEQAQQILERLRAGGLPAFLSPVEMNDRTMHRVRVGPYSERARAEQVAQRVRQDYRLDTWITQGE
ncbi:MAG: SPOR domain-containing protein [Thermoanaerobaculia bacterium]